MKVIKSLEKRGILLKRTTTKITSQEKGFLNFLRPLITAHLPLMEIVHSLHQLKMYCYQLDCQQQCHQQIQLFKKFFFGSATIALIISNEEMEDITKIVKSLKESG